MSVLRNTEISDDVFLVLNKLHMTLGDNDFLVAVYAYLYSIGKAHHEIGDGLFNIVRFCNQKLEADFDALEKKEQKEQLQ